VIFLASKYENNLEVARLTLEASKKKPAKKTKAKKAKVEEVVEEQPTE
jgi:hypothetical protein